MTPSKLTAKKVKKLYTSSFFILKCSNDRIFILTAYYRYLQSSCVKQTLATLLSHNYKDSLVRTAVINIELKTLLKLDLKINSLT